MKKRKRKVYDDDDGRVIAPMNVEGMPWYNKYALKSSGNSTDGEDKDEIKPEKGETLKMILHLYAVIIPVMLVFIGLAAVLIYLFTKVW